MRYTVRLKRQELAATQSDVSYATHLRHLVQQLQQPQRRRAPCPA